MKIFGKEFITETTEKELTFNDLIAEVGKFRMPLIHEDYYLFQPDGRGIKEFKIARRWDGTPTEKAEYYGGCVLPIGTDECFKKERIEFLKKYYQ